jgi:hypothetical protein
MRSVRGQVDHFVRSARRSRSLRSGFGLDLGLGGALALLQRLNLRLRTSVYACFRVRRRERRRTRRRRISSSSSASSTPPSFLISTSGDGRRRAGGGVGDGAGVGGGAIPCAWSKADKASCRENSILVRRKTHQAVYTGTQGRE